MNISRYSTRPRPFFLPLLSLALLPHAPSPPPSDPRTASRPRPALASPRTALPGHSGAAPIAPRLTPALPDRGRPAPFRPVPPRPAVPYPAPCTAFPVLPGPGLTSGAPRTAPPGPTLPRWCCPYRAKDCPTLASPRPHPARPRRCPGLPRPAPPCPGGTADCSARPRWRCPLSRHARPRPCPTAADPPRPDRCLPGWPCSTRLHASTWLRPRLSMLGDAAAPVGF
jgi:hypothetical protein